MWWQFKYRLFIFATCLFCEYPPRFSRLSNTHTFDGVTRILLGYRECSGHTGGDGCTLPRLGTSRILEGSEPCRGLVEPQALAEVQRNLAQQGVMSVGKGKTDA
jgi:hypothetical protein